MKGATLLIVALVALLATGVRESSCAKHAEVVQSVEVIDLSDVLDPSEKYDGEVSVVGNFDLLNDLSDEAIRELEETLLDEEQLYDLMESIGDDDNDAKLLTAESIRKGEVDLFTVLELIDLVERKQGLGSGRRKWCICHSVYGKRRGATTRKGIALWIGLESEDTNELPNGHFFGRHQEKHSDCVIAPNVTLGQCLAGVGKFGCSETCTSAPIQPPPPPPPPPAVPSPSPVPGPGFASPSPSPTPSNSPVPTPSPSGTMVNPLPFVNPNGVGLTDGEIAAIVLGSVLATAVIVLAGLFILGGLGGGAQVFVGNGPIFLRSNVEG